jgi:hypothetical protein
MHWLTGIMQDRSAPVELAMRATSLKAALAKRVYMSSDVTVENSSLTYSNDDQVLIDTVTNRNSPQGWP